VKACIDHPVFVFFSANYKKKEKEMEADGHCISYADRAESLLLSIFMDYYIDPEVAVIKKTELEPCASPKKYKGVLTTKFAQFMWSGHKRVLVPATVAVRESLEEIKDEQSAFEFTALTLWGYGTQTKEALLFFLLVPDFVSRFCFFFMSPLLHSP